LRPPLHRGARAGVPEDGGGRHRQPGKPLRGRRGDANLQGSDGDPVSLLAAGCPLAASERSARLGPDLPRVRRGRTDARLRHFPARIERAQVQAALGSAHHAPFHPRARAARPPARDGRRESGDSRRRRALVAAAARVGGCSRPPGLRQVPRVGEAVRVIELKRRRGYPASALIAAQLAEKGIEAISLGLLFGLCALLPGAQLPPLAIAGALAVAAVVVLAVLPRRAPGVAGRFLHALRAVHAERSWVRSLLWSLLSDAVDLALVGFCLHALGIDVHPAVWGMVLLSINLSLLLPATPG